MKKYKIKTTDKFIYFQNEDNIVMLPIINAIIDIKKNHDNYIVAISYNKERYADFEVEKDILVEIITAIDNNCDCQYLL